jgi:hypothetical protein
MEVCGEPVGHVHPDQLLSLDDSRSEIMMKVPSSVIIGILSESDASADKTEFFVGLLNFRSDQRAYPPGSARHCLDKPSFGREIFPCPPG